MRGGWWGMRLVNQLFEIPTADPEDGRRRRLLNILLFGVVGLILLMARAYA